MTAVPNYLVDGLVTSVRNKYITPNSQNLFQDTDVVSLMDESMRETVVPAVVSCREDFWTSYFDQAVTGAASYTIPKRACGGILRDVVFVDPSGNEIEMTRLSPAQIKSTFPFGFQLPLYTFGFFLKYDSVLPYPQQSQNATQYTLRMKIFRRPGNLTLSSNCGQITNINGKILTLSFIDPTWTTSTLFDIIQNFPLFTSISDDTAISSISTLNSTITLTNAAPVGLTTGMYVCPQYMSCIPQLVYEAWPYLVRATITQLATSIGDQAAADRSAKLEEKAKMDFIKLFQPRVEGTPKKIVNRNHPYSWGAMGVPYVR